MQIETALAHRQYNILRRSSSLQHTSPFLIQYAVRCPLLLRHSPCQSAVSQFKDLSLIETWPRVPQQSCQVSQFCCLMSRSYKSSPPWHLRDVAGHLHFILYRWKLLSYSFCWCCNVQVGHSLWSDSDVQLLVRDSQSFERQCLLLWEFYEIGWFLFFTSCFGSLLMNYASFRFCVFMRFVGISTLRTDSRGSIGDVILTWLLSSKSNSDILVTSSHFWNLWKLVRFFSKLHLLQSWSS